MIFETKKVAELSEVDLQILLDQQIAESKFLDYKRDLPGSTDEKKKEFLFDVSSFANASGGHLIYGIDEAKGIPTKISGVTVSDPDAEILRLQNLILNGINPRIPGVELRFISISKTSLVLVIHVPKSWMLPHMVTLQGTDKFYSRSSPSKHKLDVDELRSLFSLSSNTIEQIRKFRTERLSCILANETPVILKPAPKIVLHIVPLQSFAPGTRVDLMVASKMFLPPLGAQGFNQRINLDGLLNYPSFRTTDADNYLQLFKNGIIETVNADILPMNADIKTAKLIPSTTFEQKVAWQTCKYIKDLSKLGINPPVVVMLTLTGVKGYQMAVNNGYTPSEKIDRDMLLIPEIILEGTECSPIDVKPILDAVWNASGKYESPNFDENGQWSNPGY